MPTYTFDTYSMNDVGFPSNENTFVHDSAHPVFTIAVNDDDGVLEDTTSADDGGGAVAGQTKDTSEILQSGKRRYFHIWK